MNLLYIVILIIVLIILICIIRIKSEKFVSEIEVQEKPFMVFTSAGDNTNFHNNWLDKHRNYDVWVVYYGNNDDSYMNYSKVVDKIWKRKGSKYQNFHYIYTNHYDMLMKYERFYIVDDDIIMSTTDINNLFDISIYYNLWICQPSFTPESKISSPYLNRTIPGNLLRYVNFIENNTVVFSKYALIQFMKYYDPILIAWGTDLLYMWILGIDKPDKENKYAIIDYIKCINPHDKEKNNKRELTNIMNHDKEIDYWHQIKNKYNIPNWPGNQTYSTILCSDKDVCFKENTSKSTFILAIQTVFILKENLPFLREWIIYHMNIGFTKFFLYDNTGSIGATSSNTTNKYSFNFDRIITIDDNEIKKELDDILNEFKENIIYVKWQPKDDKGNIIYGQVDSIKHYIENYGSLSNYTSYTDLDEFIFSVNDTNIKEYIIEMDNKNISRIVINQKKFLDRFCTDRKKKVIDINDTIEEIDTSGWAPKNIVRNKSINIKDITGNIHHFCNKLLDGDTITIPIDTIRFNHYNVNKKQIEWMKGFYNKDNFVFGTDTTMNRYNSIINRMCNNMCSDKNNIINMELINKSTMSSVLAKLCERMFNTDFFT